MSPTMSDYLVVLVTAASEAQAREMAVALLEKKLAACVNLVPVTSLFVWEGRIHDEAEVLMIVKTTEQAAREKIVAAVKDMHSYDVPEIIGLPIVLGSADYLKWIGGEVSGG